MVCSTIYFTITLNKWEIINKHILHSEQGSTGCPKSLGHFLRRPHFSKIIVCNVTFKT